LSHAKLATTEAHYLQRQTSGPDVQATLDRFADGEVATESIRKVSTDRRVAAYPSDHFRWVLVRPKGFEPLTF
jgi:hypothetical protein